MTHEDIRFKVLKLLRSTILRVLDELNLNEFRDFIENEQDIPLIIKNERILEGIGRPDIEVFGGRIVIEVKVKQTEFSKGFKQLKEYIKFYPNTEFAIITNYDAWTFYKVEKGNLTRVDGIKLYDVIKHILSSGVKVPLTTENVKNVFGSTVLFEKDLHDIFIRYNVRKSALFEVYRNIIRRLYEGVSEEEIERLFIKHTIMQMIVSACLTASLGKLTTPEKACSGDALETEIVLPYLNWWTSIENTEDKDKRMIHNITESIYSRAMLFDWQSNRKEDIFRELYEIMIDAETRRKLGEYYTPLWLVEFMIDKISKDFNGLKDKIVLDPFCGSGAFLVVSFYRKVDEGEDPDKAIREVIGFDINPLAVSIARAELMLAYNSVKRSETGVATPLVFHTNSANLLIRSKNGNEYFSFLEELKEIEKRIEFINYPLFASGQSDFSEVLKIEAILRHHFKEVAMSGGNIAEELRSRIISLKSMAWNGEITKVIVDTLAEEKCIEAISKLIEKYGDGVWAIAITSLFAPYIIRKLGLDIVVTNPPWNLMTVVKGSYGELLRSKAKELLKGYKKAGQIISGADISSVLLYGCIGIVKRGLAFLMPRDAAYVADSCYGLGKIMTYAAIKNYNCTIYDVNFDAFQHGIYPSIVFLKKVKSFDEIPCYLVNVKCKNYSRTCTIDDVTLSISKKDNYREYIRRIEEYVKTSADDLSSVLGVDQIVSMGLYIRGLFGGAKKQGAKKYAGLVFDVKSYDSTTDTYAIQLYGTKSIVKLPRIILEPYWKKLVYAGKVFPFYLDGFYNVLLSSEDSKNLKLFLRKIAATITDDDDKNKILVLMEELQQPKNPKILNKSRAYIIYRCDGTFVSVTFISNCISEEYDVVIESHCSYIETSDTNKAYYYSAILNYLAYKVLESNKVFVRNQFLRPLLAIQHADLTWQNLDWQYEVAKLSELLHK